MPVASTFTTADIQKRAKATFTEIANKLKGFELGAYSKLSENGLINEYHLDRINIEKTSTVARIALHFMLSSADTYTISAKVMQRGVASIDELEYIRTTEELGVDGAVEKICNSVWELIHPQ